MQTNIPCTDVEHILKETDALISKSDLAGNITYVNRDFVEITGYTEAQVVGGVRKASWFIRTRRISCSTTSCAP